MDDIETGLVGFLLGDPAIRELLETKPQPPRFFPGMVPQSAPVELPHVRYWLEQQDEGMQLGGASTLPVCVIVLECRIKASSPKQAKLLANRIKHSKGPNPTGRELHGFAGNFALGYVVQYGKVEGPSYRYEQPVKATDLGTHVLTLEVTLWWNSVA